MSGAWLAAQSTAPSIIPRPVGGELAHGEVREQGGRPVTLVVGLFLVFGFGDENTILPLMLISSGGAERACVRVAALTVSVILSSPTAYPHRKGPGRVGPAPQRHRRQY